MAGTASPAAASSPKSQKSDTPPAADTAPIEVGGDNLADDGDSALGTEASSSSAYINSGILDYRTMHGRTYHSGRGTAQYSYGDWRCVIFGLWLPTVYNLDAFLA